MNKGFKSLPEYVQRKIDPEMAQKYQTGGSVMPLQDRMLPMQQLPRLGQSNNHPVFSNLGQGITQALTQRVPEFVNKVEEQAKDTFGADTFTGQQASLSGLPFGAGVLGRRMFQQPQQMQTGGEVNPAPMMPAVPAPMANQVPEEQRILMEVEGEMEAEGRDYINQMMGGIDAADDVVSMINALRGNEAPLESRYAELAQYVGEADAQKTPESVLAMVQPTIMMTEEGVVDSGIGAMMREIADASMENEMGQGVGQLMMMGAGNTPPANFSQGGPVHLQTGGDPSLEQMYQQRLKMRQDILGGTDQQAELDRARDLSQSQFFFDLANAALAAGAPTAQPMSAAERIMGGLQQSNVFGNLGQSAREVEALKRAQSAEEKQMALSALTSAESAFETAQERALKAQMQADQIAATAKLQLDRFGHETGMQKDRLTHASELQDKQNELQKTLISLRGLEDRKSQQLRAEIEENLAFIKADLALTNQLEAMDAQNFYDIAKMDKGFEQNKALASYQSTLDRIRDDSQRAFTATQNALNRALQEKLQLSSQDFESTLRKELKQMDLDDRAIDRQVAKVQNDIANAFRADDALRADETLALQQLKVQNDEDWRNQQQIIDQYKAETARLKEERLSTEASTTSVQYQLEDGSIKVVYAGSPEEKALMATPGVKRISITGSDYDLLTDVDVMNQYAAGETDPTITAKIQAAIVEAGQPKPGSNVTPDLPNLVVESERKRAIAGLPTQITPRDISAEEQALLANNLPFQQIGGKAFGTRAFLGNLFNKGVGIFMLGAPAPDVQDAIKQVERLNENAKVAFREMVAGRPAQDMVDQFAGILPETAKIMQGPDEAASAVQSTIDFYKQQLDNSRADMVTIGDFGERQKVENAITQNEAMIQSYEALLAGINQFMKQSNRKPLSDF